MCLGLILDEDGQKMSKSRGNTVEPWEVIDSYGADAFRWYFFTSKQPWDGYRFSAETIGEGVRLFLKQLWSTYYFYALYARAAEAELAAAGEHSDESARGDLDRWALSRTAGTADYVAERLDAYDVTSAGRAIATLVDELSNWYVRRSRRRFWDGDPEAFRTLRTCLLAVAKMLAPLCPFITDEIYENLDGERASVHLCDFPQGREIGDRDVELEQAMDLARETVRLGLGARGKAKIKVRQPLGEAVVVADGRERSAIERLADIVRDELNVRRVRFVEGAEELSSYEVKANYRRLGPQFGSDMPAAASAIAALDPAHVASALREGREIGISVAGREHLLSGEDLLLSMRAPEGYSVEREGAHAVALDLTIDDDLLREGRAREIVHAVQSARKSAGLQVEDRIVLALDGDQELLGAAETHREHIASETLAVQLARRRPRRPRPLRARGTRRAGARRSPSAGRHPAEGARGVYASAGSSSCSSFFLGYAPTTVLTGWPALKRIIVGIDITPKREAVWGFSSMSSLTIRRSLRSDAISSSTGATTRQGPHHGAQKSTSTGLSDSMTSASKLLSVTCVSVPAMWSPLIAYPHYTK